MSYEIFYNNHVGFIKFVVSLPNKFIDKVFYKEKNGGFSINSENKLLNELCLVKRHRESSSNNISIYIELLLGCFWYEVSYKNKDSQQIEYRINAGKFSISSIFYTKLQPDNFTTFYMSSYEDIFDICDNRNGFRTISSLGKFIRYSSKNMLNSFIEFG